jgi:molybdopterin-synthase adenylyltransferase
MDKHNRQSFLGPNSESTLRSIRAAIIGLGGGGSHIAQQLAHIGVGNLFLIDPDTIDKEGTNLNRLIGGTEKDVEEETLKVEIAKRLISSVDSKIQVHTFATPWQDNLPLLRDADVVFGGIDGLLQRRDIESATRRYMTPYIDIGMDVHEIGSKFSVSGQVTLSMPGQPCMKCMGIIRDDYLAQEAGLYGAAGGRPQVVWSNGVLASAAVGLFMQLVTPWAADDQPIRLLEYDGNRQTLTPSQKLKYLDQIKCDHFIQPLELGDPFL